MTSRKRAAGLVLLFTAVAAAAYTLCVNRDPVRPAVVGSWKPAEPNTSRH